MNTKNTIITIMITFCLTATLFMILPIRSANNPYDPWIDYNDDGTIGLSDLVMLANSYGTTGTPINKTALLLELQNNIAELQTVINTLNAAITELQNNNTELENRVSWLEGIYGLPIVNISGLTGYWRFNEGLENIARDSSGNSNDGTLYGPTWVDGKYGKAVSFDGIDDYVEVPQSSTLDIVDSVSVTAWVYPKAPPALATILSRWYDGTEPDRGIVLQLMPGLLHFGVINDDNHLYAPFSFEINKWHYVAATWNGSVSRVYVNGMEIGNRSTSGSFTNQHVDLGIGSDLNPFAGYFNGTIDNVMIYNRSLTAEEIMANYLLPPP